MNADQLRGVLPLLPHRALPGGARCGDGANLSRESRRVCRSQLQAAAFAEHRGAMWGCPAAVQPNPARSALLSSAPAHGVLLQQHKSQANSAGSFGSSSSPARCCRPPRQTSTP